MATEEQLAAFRKKKRAGMTGKKTLEERQKQIAKPKIQKRRADSKKLATAISSVLPGLGVIKIGKVLATRGPNFVKKAKAALNSKDNKDALRLAFGLDKKVGGKTKTKIIKSADGKTKTVVQTTPGNLVKPRFGKGGTRPISKAAQDKAKKTRTVLATGAAAATATALKDEKKQKSKSAKTSPKASAKITDKTPTVNQANRVSKEQSGPVSKKDPTEGGRFVFYPGQTSKDLGLMYEVDRNKMSDEVRERLEEAELYEGDSKGGRVGKGKKKKVSQAPRGVRSAIRGFKPNMGASKGSKRTRGTGGGWV